MMEGAVKCLSATGGGEGGNEKQKKTDLNVRYVCVYGPALEQEAEQWLLHQSGAEGWRWRDGKGGPLHRNGSGGVA